MQAKMHLDYKTLSEERIGQVLFAVDHYEIGGTHDPEALHREHDRFQAYQKRVNRISEDVPRIPEHENPFYTLVGSKPSDGLTNGKIRIPGERPQGTDEWARHEKIRALKAVTKPAWPTLLQVAEGMHYKDLTSITPQMIKERKTLERKKNADTAREEEVAGQCIDLNLLDKVERVTVSFGDRLLIEGHRKGTMIYLVDSPNYGVGLYVFFNRTDAVKWASGTIDFKEARARAIGWMEHGIGWETKAREMIRSASEGDVG